MERSAAQMEKNLENLKRIQEDSKKASTELDKVLTRIAARASKKEEIQRHKDAFKEIEDALARSGIDAEKNAARKKEAEWVETANRLVTEYNSLKSNAEADE